MQIERWEEIKGNIKDKFTIEENGQEHLDDEGGVDIEYLIFLSPIGKIRLEFVSKPVILDKKMIFSKRIGSDTTVDYLYSDKEKSHKLIAYKWNNEEDDWVEIEAKNFV